MRGVAASVLALGALIGARAARSAANAERHEASGPEVPFAPSVGAAPFLSLGYQEVAADVLYVRMLGYFMGDDSVGHDVANLAEAVTTLDPHFHRAYDTGANAMMLAKHGVDRNVFLRATALLERGMRAFPDDWRLPYLAGQIYTQDLKTENPVQQRAWDEKGTLLIESAIRKPGAPMRIATWAATMRTKLGQHERARAGLRELLLVTSPGPTRERLTAALAELEHKDASAVAAEVFAERSKFEKQWKHERPSVSATFFTLIGPPLQPGFDVVDLATGGHDLLVEPDVTEPEPLE
jgi:hypothetical protein